MSLTPQAIAYQEAHIGEDRKGDIIAAAAICLFAASTATILRFVSRQLAKAALKLDDWLLVVGLVSASCVKNELIIRLIPWTNSELM